MTHQWTFLARPHKPDGHRFFRHTDGRIAIADNSGRVPYETDDGPLFLDPQRQAELSLREDGARIYFPVVLRDGDAKSCAITTSDLRWLLGQGHWDAAQVTVDCQVRELVVLLRALEDGAR